MKIFQTIRQWIGHHIGIDIAIIVTIAVVSVLMFSNISDRFIPNTIKTQENIINTDKDKQIEQFKDTISELQKQNVDSVKKYTDLKRKIFELEGKKQSIKKPEGASEIKNRFRDLGYNPK